MPTIVRASRSASATLALGRSLGQNLADAAFVALCGPLGAGKTQFAKGVALGLGVDSPDAIVSPTFVLVREVVGRRRLVHADVYRLATAREAELLGLDEQRERGAIVVVEWADRFPDLWPDDAIWITFEHAGGDDRTIRIQTGDDRLADALNKLLPPGAAE